MAEPNVGSMAYTVSTPAGADRQLLHCSPSSRPVDTSLDSRTHRAAYMNGACDAQAFSRFGFEVVRLCASPGRAVPCRAALSYSAANRRAVSRPFGLSPLTPSHFRRCAQCLHQSSRGEGERADLLFLARHSRRQGLRVPCTLAPYRPTSNPDGCDAPCLSVVSGNPALNPSKQRP